jgi:hypothetical protein
MMFHGNDKYNRERGKDGAMNAMRGTARSGAGREI